MLNFSSIDFSFPRHLDANKKLIQAEVSADFDFCPQLCKYFDTVMLKINDKIFTRLKIVPKTILEGMLFNIRQLYHVPE